MAKENQADTAPESPVSAPNTAQTIPEITLSEFMQKLSLRDGRVELVNAFYFTEKKTGVVKDLETKFQARFTAFTTMVIED